MARVTTVLIGCGGRGVRAHGAHAVRSDKLQLVAVCDLDDARRAAASRELGVPGVKDYHELLDRPDVQSVIVATNAKWHAPIALDAIRAGKHVMIEKPLAEDAATARRLADAAEERGVIGMVGYQFRFSDFALQLKREAERIDPIQALMTIQRGPMGPQYFFPDHYGGVVDTATHTIHMAMWVMGGEPEGVYGSVHRGSVIGDQTIEFMNLMVEYDGGSRAATVVSSMFGMQAANLVQVVGTRGHVSSPDRKVLHVVTHEGVKEPRGGAAPAGMETRTIQTRGGMDAATGNMLDHFADLVTGTAKVQQSTTLREGMYAVAVTEAMVKAAETGRRIPLSEIL
ncbi:MAG: Gfo/Idh/MocA family oxidoreductase [Chloroflexi bacterium]|nr:Gfo/Idh/MocA family oxidoreductase [Chloroflexota bacterium]